MLVDGHNGAEQHTRVEHVGRRSVRGEAAPRALSLASFASLLYRRGATSSHVLVLAQQAAPFTPNARHVADVQLDL